MRLPKCWRRLMRRRKAWSNAPPNWFILARRRRNEDVEGMMNTMTATAAATKVKGPIVWLNMDQQELDDAYDQIVYAPNRDQVGKGRLANSAEALKRIGKPLRFAYGPTPIEGLDVYCTKQPNAPIALFVHGGDW